MPQPIEDQDIFELAAAIVSSAADLNAFLKERMSGSLSFANPAPNIATSPENSVYYRARAKCIEAAERLVELVRGPRDVLLELSFQHCASASLQLILRYNIHHRIPLEAATTYAKIANEVGSNLSPALVERVLQHSMSFGLFAQPSSGQVAHNAVSALLVTDPDLEAWLYLCTNIAYPAGAVIPKAIEKYGVSSEANETAYGVSIGRKISQFERFREADGHDEHEMFARAMKGISAGGAYDVRHVVEGGYPWDELEAAGVGLVVDVGGGPGHVSIALAKRHSNLRFEVQDLPETVDVGARNCPEELKERIVFRAHDFFKRQPLHDLPDDQAVVYFARFILHDWSDKYASQILQALAEGMRPRDRLILNEVVVPEPGELPRAIERKCHDRDLLMLMNLNGRERTLHAFNDLFQAISPPLKIARVHKPPQGELSLIEVVLDNETGRGDEGAQS